ncbi:hypothetical protein J1605_012453 [Eschrichtius robustus]|uniref:Ubiquinol-cytochrome C reductase hinge domain-containing protein n=1 Tax=Eschrichtius robustus TaxID=9764 RepID=A0AB34GMD7_ESCRO|nr:hypothetical protein J1605_012453 [Eschrichtius robustus]
MASEALAVCSLPPAPGRQTGLGAPSLSASPAAPSPRSPVHWLPSPSGLASGVSAPAVCQADAGGPAPSVWLGSPGPGLPASVRASEPRPPPPSRRAIPDRPFDIRDSAARPSPSVTSVPTARLVSPASVARPASPQTGPPGLAPRAPRPGRGAGPPAGLVSAFTVPSPVSHGIHAPTQRSGFQCPGLGLAPGLPASPPAPPGRWAVSARCQSSNRAGGALGPEAELFAGAASRDVASMVVAAATSQNQQLRARQASGAAILGRCASPRVAFAGHHLEKVPLLLLVLNPPQQSDMVLEEEQRMLAGSGDPNEEEEEEEELVDPLTTVREQCEQLEKCVKAREQLELCDERVSSRSQTEDCTEELFDFLHARDHCVSQPKVRKGKAYSGQGRLGADHLFILEAGQC